MKILLQNTDTRLYLGRGGNWIDNPEAALAFLDGVRAKDYSIYRRLQNVQVIAWPAPDAQEMPSAAAIAALVPPRELPCEPSFIARENAVLTEKEIEMKANRTCLTNEPLMAHQMAETVGEKTVRKPREPKARRTDQPAEPGTATVVEVWIDVGLGNSVYIRGQGDGLSWDKGQPLECVDGKRWVWSTKRASGRVVFKLLLNDEVWCKGGDLTVEPGGKIDVIPSF